MLLRSWLDPWDLVCYLLPVIVALLPWETAIARRIPLGAGLATAVTGYLQGRVSLDGEAISYLIPATLALVVLAVVLYRPGSARLRSRAPSREQRQSYVTPLA